MKNLLRRTLVISFVLALVVLALGCSKNGDGFLGSSEDDDAMPETGAWLDSVSRPAQIFHVRPPGETYGTGDGSSWTNAFSGLPDARVRDATYFFASGEYFDPSSGVVENYIFDDEENGESYIFLVKATQQDHGSDEGFEESLVEGTASFGPFSFVTGRYVIDGRNGLGDGTYGFHISHRNCEIRETEFVASPIFFPWNCETEYLAVLGTEIEDCGNHDDPTTRSQDAVYAVEGPSHVVFKDNYLHDAWRNLFFLQGSFDVMLEHNLFERAGLHHEANTMAFRDVRNLVVRRNTMVDSVNCFVSLDNVRNVTISANVLTRTLDDWDNWSAIFSQQPAKNVLIAGNTFHNLIGLNTGIRFTADTENLRVVNNLWAQNQTNQIMLNGEHSHNAFWENYRTDGSEPVPLDDNIEDENKQVLTSDPFTDCEGYDFTLVGPTSSGLVLEDPFVEIDLSGNTRGSDGTWDRGAYEYSQ